VRLRPKFRSGSCARPRSWQADLAASSGVAAPAVERRWRSYINLLKHQTASPGQASLASWASPAGPSISDRDKSIWLSSLVPIELHDIRRNTQRINDLPNLWRQTLTLVSPAIFLR
jgi:hypothetical protein